MKSEEPMDTSPEGWMCDVVDGEDGLELVVGDELYDVLVALAEHSGVSVEELVADSLERLAQDGLDKDAT